MSHCDDEVLALLALGEDADSTDEAHLAACSLCQSRLDQLSAVVSTARSITPDDRPLTPPDSVWQAIVAEIHAEDAPPATVTSIDAARSRRRGLLFLVAGAAAAVGLVFGGLATAALMDGPDSSEVVASADLGPIGDSGFTGTAVIRQGDQGAVLNIDVPGLPQVDDGYYEVWMATPDTQTMVAIGTLSPGQQATLALPAGMAVGDFPVVDVSVEHFDGDTGHSAVSVVRGQLQA